MDGWQETPRSEELGGKYGLESRGFTFSCTLSQQQETTHQPLKHLQMLYYAGFKGGGGYSLRDFSSAVPSGHLVCFFLRNVILLHVRIG